MHPIARRSVVPGASPLRRSVPLAPIAYRYGYGKAK